MWDTLFSWISSHFPQLAIIIIVIIATWFIAKLYFSWTRRIEDAEKECSKINNNISPQLKSISDSLGGLKESFNNLIVYLSGKDNKMDKAFYITKSPIELSELGKRVLSAVEGDIFVDNNLGALIKEIDSYNIKTALDAQTYAPIAITKFSNTPLFNDIKNFIFRNPYYKEKNKDGEEISIPIDLPSIINLVGIYLRNKYLERHPELNPSEAILV